MLKTVHKLYRRPVALANTLDTAGAETANLARRTPTADSARFELELTRFVVRSFPVVAIPKRSSWVVINTDDLSKLILFGSGSVAKLGEIKGSSDPVKARARSVGAHDNAPEVASPNTLSTLELPAEHRYAAMNCVPSLDAGGEALTVAYEAAVEHSMTRRSNVKS